MTDEVHYHGRDIPDRDWALIQEGDLIRFRDRSGMDPQYVVVPDENGRIRGWSGHISDYLPLYDRPGDFGIRYGSGIEALSVNARPGTVNKEGKRWNIHRHNVGGWTPMGYGGLEVGDDPGC